MQQEKPAREPQYIIVPEFDAATQLICRGRPLICLETLDYDPDRVGYVFEVTPELRTIIRECYFGARLKPLHYHKIRKSVARLITLKKNLGVKTLPTNRKICSQGLFTGDRNCLWFQASKPLACFSGICTLNDFCLGSRLPFSFGAHNAAGQIYIISDPGTEYDNGNTMRDLHYRVKSLRLSENVWRELQAAKKNRELSWNMFFRLVLQIIKEKSKTKENQDARNPGKNSAAGAGSQAAQLC